MVELLLAMLLFKVLTVTLQVLLGVLVQYLEGKSRIELRRNNLAL